MREIDWGQAEGMLVKEEERLWGEEEAKVIAANPKRKARWDVLPVYPYAETYNQLLRRIMEELKKISSFHGGETVTVFSHGRVIKTLLEECLAMDEVPYPHNCGAAVFRSCIGKPLELIEVRN